DPGAEPPVAERPALQVRQDVAAVEPARREPQHRRHAQHGDEREGGQRLVHGPHTSSGTSAEVHAGTGKRFRRLSTGREGSATTARTAATSPRKARRCDVAHARARAPPGRERMTLTEARSRMNPRSILIWTAVAIVGAVAWGVCALARGENIYAIWLVAAALGSYAIAYRFYARFIVRRRLQADDSRATPGERVNNGTDFQPMDRRVLF